MNITNRKVTEYLDGLYRPLTPQLEQMRREAEAEGIPVILRDTERFLAVMLTVIKPSRILEIGTATGYSSSCFAEICGEDTEIVTLESDSEMCRRAGENIRKLGYGERIRVCQGDAQETMQELSPTFDFVFIDAAKSHYRSFFDGALKLCRKGSVLICDNVLMKAKTVSEEYDPKKKYRTSIRRMRDFLQYITALDRVETCVFPAGDGISVSVVKPDAGAAE